MKNNYTVLVRARLSDLALEVDQKIKEGWMPVGGPFVTVNHSYAQALWRVR